MRFTDIECLNSNHLITMMCNTNDKRRTHNRFACKSSLEILTLKHCTMYCSASKT